MSHMGLLATCLPSLDHPGNLFRNPLGVGQPGAGPPQHEGLVAILHRPNMIRAIFIYFGVGINESELDPKQLKVLVLSGQEKPSRPGMKLFGKALEHGWTVVLRVDRERVHKNIPAHSIAEELLHLHQMRRCQGASIRAARVHEVDGYNLVLEQIVVEVHLLPCVRRQRHVGKMQLSKLLAGRDRGSTVRGTRLASRQRPDDRSKRSRCEQLSSGYRWHGQLLFHLLALRSAVGIPLRRWLDFPAQHHRVVFMNGMWAVECIAPGPVPETEKEFDPLVLV